MADVLEMNGFRAGMKDPEIYSLFTSETWPSLHLIVSKMLKEGTVSYLSSNSKLTNV